MKQYGFYFDSTKCTGCKTCQVSCKDEKDLDLGPKFRRVYEFGGGSWQKQDGIWQQNVYSYYLSISCNHCSNPTCVEGCPTGAMHKRAEDGLVVVDQTVCVGCRYCELRCPYGAPQYDEKKKLMSKCDGCYERVAKGMKPVCVESCHNVHWTLMISMSYVSFTVQSVVLRLCQTLALPIQTSLLNHIKMPNLLAIKVVN